MEEWLQTEWWDWKVYTANLTEAKAQIGIVGPKARTLLEALGGMDLSEEALPFMGWADGTLGGFKVRVYRISFSGELSYEDGARRRSRPGLLGCLSRGGRALGAMPYGTEALHVMRAEKGFINDRRPRPTARSSPRISGFPGRSRRRRTTISASARRSGSA